MTRFITNLFSRNGLFGTAASLIPIGCNVPLTVDFFATGQGSCFPVEKQPGDTPQPLLQLRCHVGQALLPV
jgi:hypothetical protein